MAKRGKEVSGTFFVKQVIAMDGTTFAQASIDISSFVNVLDGEVLKIKRVWTDWTQGSQPITGTAIAASGAAAGASAGGQVTTESRTGLISLSSTKLIAKSTLYAHIDATANIDYMQQQEGLNPLDFEDGKLVATDTLYFSIHTNATDTWAANISYTVMMECVVFKMSLSDAQAVLVSNSLD